MTTYNCIALCTFGLEALVARELKALGYTGLRSENGKIFFEGTLRDIARCNIWLRTADRIVIRLGEFLATSFDELFEGVSALPWTEWLPKDACIHVIGRSHGSVLHSVPDCQSITKKAIVEQLKKKTGVTWLPEDGPLFKIEVSLLDDRAALTLDTTGLGLHHRGYRKEAGEAPLRETLCAAMVLLSDWNPERPLLDPFCGSGTIPIEAALIARNRAPALNRDFSCQFWPWMPRSIWKDVEDEAISLERQPRLFIRGSDCDSAVIRVAQSNAARAGMEDDIAFAVARFQDLEPAAPRTVLITNPPYGKRMGDMQESEELIRLMGAFVKQCPDGAAHILSPHADFETLYGKKSIKNRKLYNGNLKCYLYQYPHA